VGIIDVLGGLAALFAVALIALPGLRVVQGTLQPRQAAGLWLAGAGFGLLAAAALWRDASGSPAAILAGVTLAVAGNIVQRRATRGDRPVDNRRRE
jgi:hypothetical protein